MILCSQAVGFCQEGRIIMLGLPCLNGILVASVWALPVLEIQLVTPLQKPCGLAYTMPEPNALSLR